MEKDKENEGSLNIQGKNITGVLDILIPKKTLNNSILVSGYKKIKKDKPCYTLQIYKADLTDNFTSLDFQEFLENSLQQKVKQLIPLTGGASADINRIVLANEDVYQLFSK